MDENITNFSDITGANADVALRLLEMAGGDLEAAIQLYFEHPELQTAEAAPPAPPSRAPAPAQPARYAGRTDLAGVIHLDSDDDIDDGDFGDDYDDEDDEIQIIARNAQEEEDAAMARRLQEEAYTGATGEQAEGVRSPIARRTETLVGGEWDHAENGEDVMYAYMQDRARRQAAQARPSPFNQSIWNQPIERPAARERNPAFISGIGSHPITIDDSSEGGDGNSNGGGVDVEVGVPADVGSRARNARGSGDTGGGRGVGSSSGGAQRLVELFRPPFELMYQLDWDDARADGKAEKRWLLVNLQDMSDFNCQALNRDIWKDQSIQDLVHQHFIFLQYSKDDPHSERYIGFYFPSHQHENADIYPHVSVIDPRTGEQVKVWSGRPFPSAADFYAQLVEFLDRYSLDSGAKNPVVKEVRRTRAIDVDRMTEEEMLEMALQNSLENTQPEASSSARGGSGGNGGAVDPDELTREGGEGGGAGGGAGGPPPQDLLMPADATAVGSGPTPAATPPPPPARPQTGFSRISATNPHTEPENDPAVTRIQFRHRNGRVIRRFRLDDPVRRIYEWLRAEPIEGIPPGAELELKSMPQGQDLMASLGQTIGDAGLKQGTVMIEVIAE